PIPNQFPTNFPTTHKDSCARMHARMDRMESATMGSSRVFLTESISFRVPEGASNAIAAAARLEHATPPEYLRRLLLRHLRDVGVPLLPADQSRSAAEEEEVS